MLTHSLEAIYTGPSNARQKCYFNDKYIVKNTLLVLLPTDMNIHYSPYAYVVDKVHGVTYLDQIMYVVCGASSKIRLYNMDTDMNGSVNVIINVEEMRDPRDIAVCRHDRQLYVADCYCIWRVSADDHSYVKWLTTQSTTDTFHIWSLSLTSEHVLVTSQWPCRLRQYSSTDRQLLHHVQLPGFVALLVHAVETTRHTFVVGHRGTPQHNWQWAVS